MSKRISQNRSFACVKCDTEYVDTDDVPEPIVSRVTNARTSSIQGRAFTRTTSPIVSTPSPHAKEWQLEEDLARFRRRRVLEDVRYRRERDEQFMRERILRDRRKEDEELRAAELAEAKRRNDDRRQHEMDAAGRLRTSQLGGERLARLAETVERQQRAEMQRASKRQSGGTIDVEVRRDQEERRRREESNFIINARRQVDEADEKLRLYTREQERDARSQAERRAGERERMEVERLAAAQRELEIDSKFQDWRREVEIEKLRMAEERHTWLQEKDRLIAERERAEQQRDATMRESREKEEEFNHSLWRLREFQRRSLDETGRAPADIPVITTATTTATTGATLGPPLANGVKRRIHAASGVNELQSETRETLINRSRSSYDEGDEAEAGEGEDAEGELVEETEEVSRTVTRPAGGPAEEWMWRNDIIPNPDGDRTRSAGEFAGEQNPDDLSLNQSINRSLIRSYEVNRSAQTPCPVCHRSMDEGSEPYQLAVHNHATLDSKLEEYDRQLAEQQIKLRMLDAGLS